MVGRHEVSETERPAEFDAASTYERVSAALAGAADVDRATRMERYMREQFAFHGVGTPERRRLTTDVLRAARQAGAPDLIDFADRCWRAPQRELQYVAIDVLREGRAALGPDDVSALRRPITTKSWWDTVDALAAWPVGSIVERHPAVVAVMDEWIGDDDIWLARTALLHQLRYGERTDADRLFRYALRRADSQEFFLRKAIGWALRQYARTDPEAVRSFLASNERRLSPLTRREALKRR